MESIFLTSGFVYKTTSGVGALIWSVHYKTEESDQIRALSSPGGPNIYIYINSQVYNFLSESKIFKNVLIFP